MKIPHLIIILLFLATGCVSNSPAVEDGVSLELAQWRAATVSDVRYDIDFSLPEMPDQPVLGRETIRFEMAAHGPLQLDFRADSTALISMRVNGRLSNADFRDEHIVLPASAQVQTAAERRPSVVIILPGRNVRASKLQ